MFFEMIATLSCSITRVSWMISPQKADARFLEHRLLCVFWVLGGRNEY